MRRKWMMVGMGAIFLVLLVAAFGGAWKLYDLSRSYKGMELSTANPAPDFELYDRNGELFRLSDQRGKISLLFFGYSHCPDVCPATLAVYRELAKSLEQKNRADDVRLVFITVDPERDTPERLQEYLPRYGEHVIGLTGTQEELEPVWDAYGVVTEKIEMPGSSLGYAVAHPSQIYLIDQNGLFRMIYPFGYSAQDIEHDILLMLRRGGRTA